MPKCLFLLFLPFSCLVFPKGPGPVVWCLTLTWRNSQRLLLQIFVSFSLWYFHYVFSSVTESCPTLCDPMNCSMPGLPVHHQLLESTQTHVHCVGDAIQASHPLLLCVSNNFFPVFLDTHFFPDIFKIVFQFWKFPLMCYQAQILFLSIFSLLSAYQRHSSLLLVFFFFASFLLIYLFWISFFIPLLPSSFCFGILSILSITLHSVSIIIFVL